MTTKQEALARAAKPFAQAIINADTLPLNEAVEAAYTPTGPDRDELRERIMARPARIASGIDRLEHKEAV